MKIESKDVVLNVNDTQVGETALVFLHHWGGSSQTWSGVIAGLRDRFRCVAIDARGAGDSTAPVTGYCTEDHAADALAVIQALGLTQYVLVGHSMGGKASQLLASKRPEGLVGLALIASSPPSPIAIDNAQREQMKAAYADAVAITWTLENVLTGSPISDAAREQLIKDALRLSPPARAGWIDVGTRDDITEAVAHINVPVLIVAGELDRVDPVSVVNEEIVARYPGARLNFLPNKGHLLPVEAVEELVFIVGGFAGAR